MNQNITIYESFQIKSASPHIVILVIMTILMKVTRKGLTFSWLPFTFRFQNTFTHQFLETGVTELVFTIPYLKSGSHFTNVLSFCGC